MVTSETPTRKDEATGARPVLNATGVICDRDVVAPLPVAAIERIAELARTFVIGSGSSDDLANLLMDVSGAEDGFAVNSRSGATLLALSTTSAPAEVVVSRGELLESDDGVRIAELIEQAGGRLIEVGSTNRTRLEDYERALTPGVSVLLKVRTPHLTSTGAHESVSIAALAALAGKANVTLVYELHRGELSDVAQAIAAGVDLVTFCGESLMGAPQSGLLVGRADAVRAARSHLLAKALKLDTLRQAALEQTLALLKAECVNEIPALRMRAESIETIGARASLVAACIGEEAVVSLLEAASDGPFEASVCVVLSVEDPEDFAILLRDGEPSVLVRTAKDALLLDARTLFDRDVMPVATAVRQAFAAVARRAGQRLAIAPRGEQTGASEKRRGRTLNER